MQGTRKKTRRSSSHRLNDDIMSTTSSNDTITTRPERRIPAGEHRAELVVVNSRFITSVAPADSPEAAREFIQRIKSEFSDASHNVPAFIIGHGASVIEHCHDDGEPSGTAGRPMLAVLRGSQIGDVVVVVTRYFGGTKLGKGGLVRAYGDAVKAGLEDLPLAKKVATHTLMAAVPYSFFEQARLLVEEYKGEMLDETFGVDVTLTIRLEEHKTENFRSALFDASHGQIRAEIMEYNPETRFPL